jgi:hypothetical protein
VRSTDRGDLGAELLLQATRVWRAEGQPVKATERPGEGTTLPSSPGVSGAQSLPCAGDGPEGSGIPLLSGVTAWIVRRYTVVTPAPIFNPALVMYA